MLAEFGLGRCEVVLLTFRVHEHCFPRTRLPSMIRIFIYLVDGKNAMLTHVVMIVSLQLWSLLTTLLNQELLQVIELCKQETQMWVR